MKHIKLQQDILKVAEKGKITGIHAPFAWGEYDNYMAIIVESNYCCFVPKPRFYLDTTKVFEKVPPVAIEQLVQMYNEEYNDVYDTGTIRTLSDGTKVKVFSGDNFEVWINEKNFTYFKDGGDYRYEARDDKSALKIYNEFNVLEGYLLPIRH